MSSLTLLLIAITTITVTTVCFASSEFDAVKVRLPSLGIASMSCAVLGGPSLGGEEVCLGKGLV
jgi:hypothetical protein